MVLHGERHHQARLTDREVDEMRNLRELDPEYWTYRRLSVEFRCSVSTAYRIVECLCRVQHLIASPR